MKKFLICTLIFLLVPQVAFAAKKAVSPKPVGKVAKTQAKAAAKTSAKKAADLDCKHFSNWAEAQKVFEQNGGTKHDIYDLDRDKDGIACEELKK